MLVGKLGQGGMGAVYAGLQMPLRREVAVKLITAEDVDEVSLKRFGREASTMAALDHPNILKLYDFGPEDAGASQPFMVLELVQGRELHDEINARRERGEAWTVDEVRRLAYQVLSALETAHRAGLIHRDIKPQNVMLTRIVGDDNHVKILDFGLAKAVELFHDVEKLSQTGQALGTPAYMAPEQFDVKRMGEIDERIDLYAFGIILFEIFMGKRPFRGSTWKDIAIAKLSPAYDPLTEVSNLGLSEGLRRFFETALARDAGQRYPNALAMYQALDEVLQAEVPVGLRRAAESGEEAPALRTPAPVMLAAPPAAREAAAPPPRAVTPPAPAPAEGGTLRLESETSPEAAEGEPRAEPQRPELVREAGGDRSSPLPARPAERVATPAVAPRAGGSSSLVWVAGAVVGLAVLAWLAVFLLKPGLDVAEHDEQGAIRAPVGQGAAVEAREDVGDLNPADVRQPDGGAVESAAVSPVGEDVARTAAPDVQDVRGPDEHDAGHAVGVESDGSPDGGGADAIERALAPEAPRREVKERPTGEKAKTRKDRSRSGRKKKKKRGREQLEGLLELDL